MRRYDLSDFEAVLSHKFDVLKVNDEPVVVIRKDDNAARIVNGNGQVVDVAAEALETMPTFVFNDDTGAEGCFTFAAMGMSYVTQNYLAIRFHNEMFPTATLVRLVETHDALAPAPTLEDAAKFVQAVNAHAYIISKGEHVTETPEMLNDPEYVERRNETMATLRSDFIENILRGRLEDLGAYDDFDDDDNAFGFDDDEF